MLDMGLDNVYIREKIYTIDRLMLKNRKYGFVKPYKDPGLDRKTQIVLNTIRRIKPPIVTIRSYKENDYGVLCNHNTIIGTLFDFIEDRFTINDRGSVLYNKYFKNIPLKHQERLLDTEIYVQFLEAGMPEHIRREIMEHIAHD